MNPNIQNDDPMNPSSAMTPALGKPGNSLRSLFILTCFLLSLFITPAAAEAPSYTALFVTDPTHPISTQEFDCVQNVYVYFIWKGLKGMHKVTVLWINPQKKEQDDIDLRFVAASPTTENWVALKFLNSRKESNPLLQNSGSASLSGTWSVKIFLDGNTLEEKTFNVRCD